MRSFVMSTGRKCGPVLLLALSAGGLAKGQDPSAIPRYSELAPQPPASRGLGFLRRFRAPSPDPGVRQVQATAGEGAPAAGAPEPAMPDLSVPAADRPTGGGEPTTEEEAEEAPEPTPLMKFLGMEDSPVKIYGWIQNSFTGNANGRPPSGSNFGVNPNNRANQWMGNQYYLIFEKPLEQNDEVNFGFRVDNLFGNDWQFNFMQGLFNGAFPLNWFPGFDLAQMYGEVHLPILTEGGFDIKGGRWYTLMGYEQVPAIARPLLSVPYMFNYGQPFTHFGAMTTWHMTDRINLYNGAVNGWDRWINVNYKWNYMGGFSWSSKDEKTTLAASSMWGPNQFPRFLPANQQIYPTGYINIPSLAGQRNPGYARNGRTLFTTVLTHKWSDKLTQVMETDQGWERSIPGLASGGANGAPRSDQWYSFGNWFLWQFHEKVTGVWRAEWFRDHGGARTGFSDNFYEMTLGLIAKPTDNIWIRPEARYDWAQFTTPYNDGTRSSQLTLGFDVILLY
jgi:Putative beta-barrel porin-2, OmpL-like. bbp2